jgi:hypothetical protein
VPEPIIEVRVWDGCSDATPAIEASVGGRGGWWCGWGEVTPPKLRADRAGAEQEEEVPGKSTSLTMRGGP